MTVSGPVNYSLNLNKVYLAKERERKQFLETYKIKMNQAVQVRGADGKRMGFDLVTLDGKERAALARVANSPGKQPGPKVGQYSVNVTEFEKIALRSLSEDVLQGASLVVVDEVGKMESFSKKFEARVRQIFDEDHAERKVMSGLGRGM